MVIERGKNDAETMYDTVLINRVAAPLPDDSYLQQKLDIWHVDRSKRQRFDRNIIKNDICSHCFGYNLINSWTDHTHSCFLSTHCNCCYTPLFSLLSQYDCSWTKSFNTCEGNPTWKCKWFQIETYNYMHLLYVLLPWLMFMSNCRQT